jgi:hypothetical protein
MHEHAAACIQQDDGANSNPYYRYERSYPNRATHAQRNQAHCRPRDKILEQGEQKRANDAWHKHSLLGVESMVH